MIFYFSGTGNSRYCAKRLAHRLGDEAVDAFPFLRDDHFPALTSRSTIVSFSKAILSLLFHSPGQGS